MKTYKNIECLKAKLIKNNGFKVKCWSDEGVKVNKKHYCMFQYGNMKYNFKGNCYITFRHIPSMKRQNVWSNYNIPISDEDEFITIEYDLINGTIFQFKLIREYF
jgi:hypothetical protein